MQAQGGKPATGGDRHGPFASPHRARGAAAAPCRLRRQVPEAVSTAPETPGFLHGLWHGFVFPFAWIGSLFSPEIAVYAVPNNGGWYDFGFFLGITVLGGGTHFSSKRRSD